MTRSRLVPTLIIAVVVVAAIFAAVTAQPASGYPTVPQSACSGCHSAAPSGTVTATPSTTTPAAGATYTVSVNIGLTAAGANGFWISNSAGTTNVTGNSSTTNPRTATMTAPATAGTYTYTVWAAKGPGSSGMARSTTYSITVPAAVVNPAITALSPTSGLAGSSVTITGTNLGTSGTVSFSGTAATTTSWTATRIVATVPAGISAGAKSVTVTTGGRTSNVATFTVTTPPASITSVTPSTGPVGTVVTIAGSNFGPGGVVRIGGITATTGPWTATSITATVPAGLAAGAQGVIVTPTGGTASNSATFTVTTPAPAAPVLSSLSPVSGLAGSSVTITGTNLGTAGVVSFSGTAATTTSWTATRIVATVPAGSAPAPRP